MIPKHYMADVFNLLNLEYTLFYKQHFYKQHQAEIDKNQAKAKQHTGWTFAI